MILPEDPTPEGEPPNLPIHIEPIINALRKAHFVYFNELCIWDFNQLSHRAVASIVSALLQISSKICVIYNFFLWFI